MANARDIKKRIKAVGNIRRITKTMQMIATSKFAKAQHRATASKPYTEGIFQLVSELAGRAGNVEHPLIDGGEPRPGAGPVVLVITSDRGLCGPYNGTILRLAMKRLRQIDEQEGGGVNTDVIGRKGVSVLSFNGFGIGEHHTEFGDEIAYDAAAALAQRYMDRFVAGEITGVRVIYTKFITTSRQRPEELQLLPLRPPTEDKDDGADGAAPTQAVQYEFSPEPAELLSDLLPETVKATLFQCISDAKVSEHVARMVAMKAATDNAGSMRKDLTRVYNRVRQAQITTELSEIIGGAAALG